MLPSAIGLIRLLLREGRDDQRGGFGGFGVVGFDFGAMFLGTVANGKGVGPLAFDGVEGFFPLSHWIQARCEGVFLAGHPTFARVVDFSYVAGRGDDVAGFVKLDEGGAVEKAFNVERWKGDQVGFIKRGDFEDGVPDLFDLNCT